MAANIGLNEGMVRASKTVLNNLLSDHFVLLAKTWNYHWNVKGVSFLTMFSWKICIMG